MADACASWRPADSYIITGTGTDIFLRRLLSRGVSTEDIICVGDAEATEIVDAIAKRPIESTMILGMGNIAGPGMRLAEFFANSEPWTPADFVPQSDVLPANHVMSADQPKLVEVT